MRDPYGWPPMGRHQFDDSADRNTTKVAHVDFHKPRGSKTEYHR